MEAIFELQRERSLGMNEAEFSGQEAVFQAESRASINALRWERVGLRVTGKRKFVELALGVLEGQNGAMALEP